MNNFVVNFFLTYKIHRSSAMYEKNTFISSKGNSDQQRLSPFLLIRWYEKRINDYNQSIE